VLVASLIGASTVVYFASMAIYFLQTDPRSVATALLWLVVGLATPVTAEQSRRSGLRRGERREALLVRVGLTTICAAGCAFTLLSVGYVAGAYLGAL
jgi:hypothetical protein